MLRKSIVVGAACAAIGWSAVRADTLVLSDGRKLSGAVTVGGDTYTVKTQFGDVTVDKADVSEWKHDDATPTAGAAAPTGPAAATAAPVVPAPAAANPATDPATQKGLDALASGDAATARDLLAAAVQRNPRDARAAHGLGLAYLKLGDVVRARDVLARALQASAAPDHALTINAAAVELAAGNTMRAVKIARDYLAAHPRDLDEPVLNAMGIALNLADEPTQNGAAYRAAADFYESYQAKLESAHPGQKRWGIQWLPAVEARQKNAQPTTAERSKLRALHDAEALADKRVSIARAELDRVSRASGAGGSNVEIDLAKRTLADAEAKRDAAKAAADSAAGEGVPFPDRIEAVAVDEPAPGAPGGQIGSRRPVREAAPAETITAPPIVVVDNGGGGNGGSINNAASPTTSPADANGTATTDPAATGSAAAPPTAADDAVPSGPQYAAAFPVAPNLLLTAAKPLRNAKRITVTGADGIPQKAAVLRTDGASGLALLKVDGVKLTPLGFDPSFAGGPVQCAAFATLDVFNPSAAMVAGTAAAAPAAAKDPWTVKLERDPRLSGAPLIAGGRVVGIELGAADGAVEKVPAVPAARAVAFVGADLAPGDAAADPCAVMMQVTVTHDND